MKEGQEYWSQERQIGASGVGEDLLGEEEVLSLNVALEGEEACNLAQEEEEVYNLKTAKEVVGEEVLKILMAREEGEE